MKKLFLSSLFALLLFLVAGCSTKDKEEEKNKFTIKYVDYLGNATSKDYELGAFNNPLEAVKDAFDVVENSGFISAINNSFNDNNWGIMVYENGEAPMVGVKDLVIDNNDVFEFRHECFNTVESGWGSMDDYDVLVDKLVYYYAQNKMTETLSNLDSFKASDSFYWEMMALNMMISNNYDSNIFNTNMFKESYITSLNECEYSNLSGGNLMKLMRSSRLFNISDGLKQHYKNEIEGIDDYYEYGDEYTIPLLISQAKSLGLNSSVSENLINTSYQPSLNCGTDGLVQMVLAHSIYKSYDEEIMDNFKNLSQNGVSTALELLIYAALNKNARSTSCDIIKYLVDEYYDSQLNIIKAEKADTGYNDFSNEIYASLMAYKISRDKNRAVNLFE